MTFIALHNTFGIAGNGHMIVRAEDSTPIGILHPDPSLPVPIDLLAHNTASLLNGKNPLYRFGDDKRQMFFEKLLVGFNLRFRETSQSGVSTVGATFIVLPGFEDQLESTIFVKSAKRKRVLKNFMDAGNKSERRAKTRDVTKGANKAPRANRKIPPPAV